MALIRPDPQNHNVQSPDEYTRLVRSIQEFGFLEPLIVREKKAGAASFETINGEHRLRAATDLDLAEVPVVNLGKVSDAEAEQLAIVLNELDGSSDQVRLAERLRRINETVPFEKLTEIMPYRENELKLLLRSVDFSFANLSMKDTRLPVSDEVEATADEKWLKFKLPVLRADKLLATLEKIDSDPAVAVEKCVVAFAKSPAFKAALPTAKVDKVRKGRKS